VQPYDERNETWGFLPSGVVVCETIESSSGTILAAGSAGFPKQPASPCRLGAGFTDEAGLTWAFCADQPTVTAYYLSEGGKKWAAYGKPSPAVAPIAAGFPLVLPPE